MLKCLCEITSLIGSLFINSGACYGLLAFLDIKRDSDFEMDRFFSLFQAAVSCSKWNKIRLGPSFVWCPSGHRSWTIVVLAVLYINNITTNIDS